ncbi:probable serine/threonine-protein kinase At1g01540 [Corylus avellana]|uniref:probable serine/threonine-protein kinase At1g01540 n=1 Tax=Corylus avellana TaxID=13451 RepID=UPI00286A81F3|nr:probable serine/threonine-protein kinase At1g01540 [Corylus avellana]
MSVYDAAFVNTELSKPTSIFGLRLWVVIGIFVGSLIVLALFLLSLCFTSRRNRHPKHTKRTATPPISKEIQEIVPAPHAEIQIEIGKLEHRVVTVSDRYSSGESKGTAALETGPVGSGNVAVGPEVSHLGWGRWYTLRELEAATNGLCEENVIGEGGYGIVYSGLLPDGTRVAVKNLLNNRGQAEKEFKVEVETIGRVRHKNLVRLLGYCVEGAYRMLVYEYVDNGNLDQWLQGDVGNVSPLTWDIRMNIILGTAKGLAYLHEGLEPKVVHRDVKSSNILLDRQWNAKVSDFGLAKLLCSEMSYVTTRVMGTFGYVAPEYACTGMLNEKSDVYSFGILIMEIISGRSPVDYSRPQGEVNLVDWLKNMVGNRKSEEVVDPKLPEMPASKALKRVLLVALRCVDPDATKRPKMGHVIHMLEADDLLFRDERRIGKDNEPENHSVSKLADRQLGGETSETSEGNSGRNHHQLTRWR